jgi:hypothetical protein
MTEDRRNGQENSDDKEQAIAWIAHSVLMIERNSPLTEMHFQPKDVDRIDPEAQIWPTR